jgi:hypothetical protein
MRRISSIATLTVLTACATQMTTDRATGIAL